MSTLKAIKSHFERSYDKQNITLVVITYGMTTCVISSMYLGKDSTEQPAVHGSTIHVNVHLCFSQMLKSKFSLEGTYLSLTMRISVLENS